MQIGPTIDGRIKLYLNDEGDFYLLSQIIHDASNDGNIEALADQVGEKVTEDDWVDFIRPDLIAKYKGDILKVSQILKSAHEESVEELFISSEDYSAWYSTLNQARLHLEKQYNLSDIKDDFDPQHASPELVEPLIKGNFYTHLQSLILEFLEW